MVPRLYTIEEPFLTRKLKSLLFYKLSKITIVFNRTTKKHHRFQIQSKFKSNAARTQGNLKLPQKESRVSSLLLRVRITWSPVALLEAENFFF